MLKNLTEIGKSYCSVFAVPAVVSLIPHGVEETMDGLKFSDAISKLYQAGADVVGFNCGRGPSTMIPLVREIRQTFKVE